MQPRNLRHRRLLSSLTEGITVRNATEADMEGVRSIYSEYVLNGLATFEEIAPSVDDLLARRKSLISAGLPYLVADCDSEILGYSYASPYHSRPAYRYTVEGSAYVARELGGRGVGGALLQRLIERCERGPWRQMVAVIGDSENVASIALHRRMGFQLTGTLSAIGFKLRRWVDVVLMQRSFGPGDATNPM